jgi:hypothetical protein
MIEIILWLIALFLGVAITIIAKDPIHYLMARLLGGWIPRRPRGVKGFWHTSYSYEEDGILKEENQIVELRQFGNYAIGRNLTGSAHWYKIQGKIHLQIYFTGLWENLSEGDIYHGAFQVVILPHGDRMEGKWIGFDNKQHINHGPWKWDLLSRNINSTNRKKLLDNSRQNSANINEAR